MKQHSLFLGALFTILAAVPAIGCTVYSSRPPETEVAYVDAPAPPPAEVEVIPASPGVEYVWIGGHQRWNGHAYVWERGHYDHRPSREAHYVHGHWEHRGRTTLWVDGHWG